MIDIRKLEDIQSLRRQFFYFFTRFLPIATYQQKIEDAYGEAMLNLIENKMQFDTEKDLVDQLKKYGWIYIDSVTSEEKKLENFLQDKTIKHRRLDYNLLDQRFKNCLTSKQLKIWNMRCEYKTLKEICKGIEITITNVMVTEFQIRQKYKSWYKTIIGIEQLSKDLLTDIQSSVVTEYKLGYTGATVASRLHLESHIVARTLHAIRQKIIQSNTKQ